MCLRAVEFRADFCEDRVGPPEVFVIVEALAHFEMGHGEFVLHAHLFGNGEATLPALSSQVLPADKTIVDALEPEGFGEDYTACLRDA